jgi:hypothetical protein
MVFGCSPDAPNQASTAPLLGGAGTQCRAECAITTDSKPFEASHSSPDSAMGWLFLADVTLTGNRGASISLGITADQHLVAALPQDARILVNADGKEASFTVSELLSGSVTFYRFEAAAIVHLRYAISRGTPTSIPIGDFRLIQYASSADVANSDRPWVRSPRSYAADFSTMSSCVITLALSTICGIHAYVNPYATGRLGTFQSNSGTGVSSPVTIRFSGPGATNVTITIHDPTWAGNSAQAYGPNGDFLGSVGFSGSGLPGSDFPETQTLSYTHISRVDLIPAPGDYVAYDASFADSSTTPPCSSKPLTSYDRVSDEFDVVDPPTHKDAHTGRDYSVLTHSEVYAQDSGTIVFKGPAKSAGYALVLRSALPDTRGLLLDSYFFHLEAAAPGIHEGSVVSAGQLIAFSDDSGVSTGPHLHFEQHIQAFWPGLPDPRTPWPWHHAPRMTVVVPCTF